MSRVEFTKANALLSYDPSTGILRWQVTGFEVTGLSTEGYRRVKIDGRTYQAHRIAWLIYYGEWPSGPLDHINGDKADNRLDNLHVVTVAENGRNRKRGANSKSGAVGVCWSPRHKAWRAYIKMPERNVHLGYFKDMNAAVAARKAAGASNGYSPIHGRAA